MHVARFVHSGAVCAGDYLDIPSGILVNQQWIDAKQEQGYLEIEGLILKWYIIS
jgi:hypothetical protein